MNFEYSYIKLNLLNNIDRFFIENYQCYLKIFNDDFLCDLKVKHEETVKLRYKTKYILRITSDKYSIDKLNFLKLHHNYNIILDDLKNLLFVGDVQFYNIILDVENNKPIYKLELIK